MEMCEQWKRDRVANRDWVIKHGLRTLIKQGDVRALKIVGFNPPKRLAAKVGVLPRIVVIGGAVELELSLQNESSQPQDVMIDYVIRYVRKAGKVGEKVFKWKSTRIGAGEVIELRKKHSMKVTTVRALYSGEHGVEVQVNGVRIAESSFRLKS